MEVASPVWWQQCLRHGSVRYTGVLTKLFCGIIWWHTHSFLSYSPSNQVSPALPLNMWIIRYPASDGSASTMCSHKPWLIQKSLSGHEMWQIALEKQKLLGMSYLSQLALKTVLRGRTLENQQIKHAWSLGIMSSLKTYSPLNSHITTGSITSETLAQEVGSFSSWQERRGKQL